MNPPNPNGRAGDAELDAAALARLHDLDPGGRNGIVVRVLTTFEKSLSTMLVGLSSAQERGDTGELRRISHTLKSSSASVGALALSARCADVEALARDQRQTQLTPVLAQLHSEGELALVAVRRLLRG